LRGRSASIPRCLVIGPGPQGNIVVNSLFLTGGSDFLTGPQAMAKLEDDMKNGTNGTEDTTSWETVRYAKINHAFSNWFSYNYDERADSRSWHSIVTFLEAQFAPMDYYKLEPLPEEHVLEVNYMDAKDGNYSLKGNVSIPKNTTEGELLPAVVILPHNAGANLYEQQRATQMASEFGYIGFVADTGALLEELDEELFVSRVHAAVDYVMGMDGVDPDKVAVVGFGLGGTGSLYYALSGEVDEGVKVIASMHGELDRLILSNATDTQSPGGQWSGRRLQWPGQPTAPIDDTLENKPQILILSGVDGDAMSDIIKLEETLIGMGANYEISRYSHTHQSFTNWNNDQGQYSPRASARSFDQLESVFREVFTSSSTIDEDGGITTVTQSPSVAPSVRGEEVSSESPVSFKVTSSPVKATSASAGATPAPAASPSTPSVAPATLPVWTVLSLCVTMVFLSI